MNYSITRLEVTSTNTFIGIDTDKPVSAERFIPNDKVLRDEIEDMVAELSIRYDEYVAPEVAVSKTKEEMETVKTSLRSVKIEEKKAEKISEKETVKAVVTEEVISN